MILRLEKVWQNCLPDFIKTRMKPESVNMDLSHHNMVKNEPRSLGANSQTFWISGISHLRVEVFNLYTAPSVDGED